MTTSTVGEDITEAVTLLSYPGTDRESILLSGRLIMSFIYGDSTASLSKLRYTKFCSVLTSHKNLKPETLPPTESATDQHTLRAYLQIHDWLLLSSMTLPPVEYGWRKCSDNTFEPVPTTEDVAPPQLLKITACKCKARCGARCQCKKNNVLCIDACANCNGQNCGNQNDISNTDE